MHCIFPLVTLSVAGFDVQEESIDRDEQEDSDLKYVPSQTIDVYDRFNPDDDHQDPVIWEAVQPWIPKIAQIVKDNRNKVEFSKMYPDNPEKEPSLDWVFFRKYSPDDERNSLKHHHDTNLNTVNIELSNDYEGGGLFYIKPLASTGNISDVYAEVGYEWINTVKRENTSSIVFPNMHAGDAIFYNYTVEHAVAPVEQGTRVSLYPTQEEKVPINLTNFNLLTFLFLQYSMAFFFDMDNPAVADDFEEEDDEEEFEVELYNGLVDEVDIYALLDSEEGEEEPYYEDLLESKNELLYSNLSPNESGMVFVKENELIRVVLTRTAQVISEFEIESGKLFYEVEEYDDDDEDDYLDEDEFKVKLRNEFPEKVDIKLKEKGGEVWKYMFENMEVNETNVYIAVEGDQVKVLKGGTESILLDIKIKRSKSLYAFSRDNLNDWHTEL